MPQVEKTLTGYTFTFDEGVAVCVSRLRTHTDGRITGAIKLILGKDKQEEPEFSWNFTSAQTRKQLVNQLNEKFPDWQWLSIIDSLCRQVQELARAGEPVQELWTSDDITPPEYLLEPIMLEGLPTIIFGEKGVTKSYMALVFYICLLLPWTDNPLGLAVPDRSIKTVILDWELPGTIAQWNLKKLVEGMNLSPIPLYHRHCSQPLADDIEQIQRYISELGAEVVIIDSLGRAAGGDLRSNNENTNRFFEALDKLKVTSLIIGQTAKGTEKGKSKSIYGDVFFTYYARSIFELCKAENVGEDEASVALFHRYSNLSKIHMPMGFRFSFNGNYVKIGSEAVTYNEFLDKVNRQAQILEVLRDGSKNTKEIMDALEMARGNTDVTLKRLRDKNKIVKLADNRWGLASQREE